MGTAGNAPLFVPASQWIAQLETVEQSKADAPPIEALAAFAPVDKLDRSDTSTQLAATWSLSAVEARVDSTPVGLVFVQSVPSSAIAEQSNTNETTAPSTADGEPKALPSERPGEPSFAPATMPAGGVETEIVIAAEKLVAPPAQAKSEDPPVARVTQTKPQPTVRASRS